MTNSSMMREYGRRVDDIENDEDMDLTTLDGRT